MNETENDNLTPEGELARRREIASHIKAAATMLEGVKASLDAVRSLGMDTRSLFQALQDHGGAAQEFATTALAALRAFEGGVAAGPSDYIPPPIEIVIKRLLDESPTLQGALDQRRATKCHVLLRGQVQPLYGSLSLDDAGVLKMLTPSKVQHQGETAPRDILLEQFFDVEDVQAVMVEREVTIDQPRIIVPS